MYVCLRFLSLPYTYIIISQICAYSTQNIIINVVNSAVWEYRLLSLLSSYTMIKRKWARTRQRSQFACHGNWISVVTIYMYIYIYIIISQICAYSTENIIINVENSAVWKYRLLSLLTSCTMIKRKWARRRQRSQFACHGNWMRSIKNFHQIFHDFLERG